MGESLPIPVPPHSTDRSSFEGSSNDSENEIGPRGTRSLRELNEVNENQNDIIFYCLFGDCEPISFQEAIANKKWKDAMDEEIRAIEKNDTWELTKLPKRHKPIGVKWVYKTKRKANGDVERHKARLVVKGYSQRHGIYYDEVFAPVVRLETIR